MVLTVPSRVAVIVVHGVADQAPGDTAASFVEMMVAAPLPGVRYEAVGSQSFTVEVEPLAAKWRDDRAGRPDAGRHTFRKALRQSLYSDFRSHPDPSGSAGGGIDAGLDYTDYLLHKARRNRMPGESYTSQTTRLVRRAAGEGGATSTVDVHEMYWADQSRLSGALPRIVTELFTLFFRLSRLGRDTVEIAGRQAGRDPMWRVLSALQKAVDWSFTHVFAQLTALLLVFGLFVAGIGLFAARPAPPADAPFMRDVQECADVKRRDAVCQRDAAQVLALLPAAPASASAPAAAASAAAPANAVSAAGGRDAAAGAAGGGAPLQFDPRTAAWLGFLLAVLVWLTLRYQRAVADAPMSRAIARTMVSAALVAVLLLAAWPLKLDPLWGVGLALALVLGSAYAAVLRVAKERFPFVSWSGGLLGAGLLLLALAGGVVTPGEAGALERLQRGGILAIESTLIGVLCWWVFMAVLFPLWGIASATVGVLGYRKGNVARRCSASTGRLGTLVSLLCFLTVTTALWMGLSGAVKSGLTELSYTPTFWKEESVPAAAAPSIEWARYLMLCDGGAAKGAERNAAQFIDCRFRGNTAAFSAAVAVLAGVAVYLLATLLPSVLAELGWARSDSAAEARRLGIWLTRRYRHLDRWVLAFTLLAIAFVLFVGFELLWHRNGGTTPDWFGTTQQGIARVSDELLRWLVIPGASALAVLTAFGGVLSRLLPGLRAPLDVALDVDNYLREFPRAAIPRARIFARYAALLRHVARQGYDRVVVVAHSQGTVISAELLRYLSSDVQAARQATAPPGSAEQGRGTRLQALLQTQSLRLLTLGCPLRQLYAARFPVLYGWVMQDHGGTVGPRADDIGVERWFNAYGSGDYVGRWLWNDGTAPRGGMHPVDDVLSGTGGQGPRSLYDIVQPPAAAREFQTCIGLAAHTHYFDPPDDAGAAPTVALLADALVAEPMNLQPNEEDPMPDPNRPRSPRGGIAVSAAIALAVAALLAAGCAMPPQMQIENANDPRYEDRDVRFRTTYYFRVYDPCPPTAAAGAARPPASDTLYRFRMTGKAKSLTNQVHFEAGTLPATQIDPLGASVAYDERNRQFYFKSAAETQEEAQRERELAEIERLVALHGSFATQAVPGASAASAAAAASAGMGKFRDELQSSIVARLKALETRQRAVAAAPAASAASGAAATCSGARGFQILGPEGWRVFRQDERLLMAMSSSGKPLIGTMQEIAGRVLNDQPIEAEILLPLTREELRLTRAERELDRYDRAKPESGADRLQAVIDALRREAK